MRVLFLDIDGVLNSKPFLRGKPGELGPPPDGDWSIRFDPTACARLQTIIDRTGACVVISSAWRNDQNIAIAARLAGVRHQDYIAGLLAKKGCPRAGIIDMCADGNRGDSILAWVILRAGSIRSWVAIDDAAPQHMAGAEYRTIRTYEMFGLQDEHVERAVEMLSTDMY